MSACTMKSASLRLFLSVTLGFMLFSLMSTGVAADSPAVITVDEVEGVVGETITVPVKIENPGKLAGGDVVLSYDPDVVEIKDIRSGEVIAGTMFMPNEDFSKDSLRFVWAEGGMVNTGEDGDIARISFLLKKPGSTSIEIKDMELLDIGLQEIRVVGEGGSVIVHDNGVDTERDSGEEDSYEETKTEPVSEGEGEKAEGHPDSGSESSEEDEDAVTPGTAVLTIENTGGAVGDTVTAKIKIENPGGMAGGDMVISYDPEIVEPLDVKTGNLLSGLIPISNLDYSEDSLKIAWFGLTGKTSDGVIAEISFLLKEEGRCDLELTEVSLVNAEGEGIAVDAVNGSIESGETGASIPGMSDTENQYIYIIAGIIVVLGIGIGIFLFIKRYRNNNISKDNSV